MVFKIKTKKTEHPHWILHIEISLSTKFQLKLTILIFLEHVCPKKRYLQSKTLNELYHRILHNQISLGTEFQFKQTTLILWTKFAIKGYFQP